MIFQRRHHKELAHMLWRMKPVYPLSAQGAANYVNNRGALSRHATWTDFVNTVAVTLERDNSAFDKTRFKWACDTGYYRRTR